MADKRAGRMLEQSTRQTRARVDQRVNGADPGDSASSSEGITTPSCDTMAGPNAQTNGSIEKLTRVMTVFLEGITRERPSSTGLRGDAVPVFDPQDLSQSGESWCRKVDELREIFRWNEETVIYNALPKLAHGIGG